VGINSDGASEGREITGEVICLVQKAPRISVLREETMENVATYSEARSEYTKQLATFLVPALVGWFQQTWHRNASNRQQCLSLFQSECEEIARWNADRIHDEVRVLIERAGCDYMEELMTAVFVAHTKVLTAVRLSSKEKKLSITVPKLDHFIHRIFREAARVFWKAPFLFLDGGGVVERQKNVLQIEALTSEAIGTAVRSLLPVKQILKDYLEGDHEEVEDEAISAAAPVVETPTESNKIALPELEVTDLSGAGSAPAPAPAVPPVPVSPTGPAVVNIDTQQAVTFAAYDDVYDEAADGPTLKYRSREGDDDADLEVSDALEIDEASAAPIGDDEVQDLEAPIPPAPKAAPPPMSERIADDEVEMLE
jgi:hypothetical protein